MHYYLDGYNILFQSFDEKRSLEGAREELIQQLVELSGNRRHPLTIVFDAGQEMGILTRLERSGIEVIYSSEGEDADCCLIDLLGREKNPGNTTLVTNDRFLRRRAHELDVRTLNTSDFFRRTRNWKRHDQESEPPSRLNLGRDPLFDYYLKVFEERDQRLRSDDEGLL